jgi:hypothetical protein
VDGHGGQGQARHPDQTDDGEVTEAISTITWTAASPAGGIKPGEFDEFVISAGPLPKADSMQFKTLQTYSDNTVVRWIEPKKADGSEPEHPVPTLELTPVAEGASTATPTATTGSVSAAGSSTKASDSSAASQSSVNLAIGLAVAALIVGLVAGGLALRRRSPAAGPSGS